MKYIDFMDRYGYRHPDPKTVCRGRCEGLGVYPEPEIKNQYGDIPIDCEWKFKVCPDCGGTGKRDSEMNGK